MKNYLEYVNASEKRIGDALAWHQEQFQTDRERAAYVAGAQQAYSEAWNLIHGDKTDKRTRNVEN